jgi:hypothetical protein
MRAVSIEQFGGPEVLNVVEVPDPVPGEGQLLVQVDHGRAELRRHPPGRELLPLPDEAAADPRR